MATKKQEDFKNRALSVLLRKQGVDCDYERRIGRKKLDIVANVEGRQDTRDRNGDDRQEREDGEEKVVGERIVVLFER